MGEGDSGDVQTSRIALCHLLADWLTSNSSADNRSTVCDFGDSVIEPPYSEHV